MNKNEVSEIRKHFNPNDDFLVLNRVITSVVDAESNVKYSKLQSFTELTEHEIELYFNTLKHVISKKLNKNFTEYQFTTSEYTEGSSQDILFTAMDTKFSDLDTFVNNIVQNMAYSFPYAIIAAHCTYTLFHKNKSDEEDKFNEESFKFIVTAICPIGASETGFGFNFMKDEFLSSSDKTLYISKKPSDGFMFPTFSNRTSDINSVMYYAEKYKEPNISIIEAVLGCEFKMSADQEKSAFRDILTDVAEDYISYQSLQFINSEFEILLADSKSDTDPVVLEPSRLKDLLRDMGVPEDKIESVDKVYADYCGAHRLHVSNLISTSMSIKCDGISIAVKDEDIQVMLQETEAGRRLIINIPDSELSINDFLISN